MNSKNILVIVIIALLIIWFVMPYEAFSTGEGALLQLATSRPYYNPGELIGEYPYGNYGPYAFDYYNPWNLYYPYNRWYRKYGKRYLW